MRENTGTITLNQTIAKHKNSVTITLKKELGAWKVSNSIDHNYASFPSNQWNLAFNYALGMKAAFHKCLQVHAVYIDRID